MKSDSSMIDDLQTINTNSNDSNHTPSPNNNMNESVVKKENYSQKLSSISSSSPPINCHSQSHSPSLTNSIPSTVSSVSTTVPSIGSININENYHQFSSQQHQQQQHQQNNNSKSISNLLSPETIQEYNNNNNSNIMRYNNNSPGLLQNISQNHYSISNKRVKHQDMALDVTNKEFSEYF